MRKYPNPQNKAITAIDVVRQDVEKGVIKSELLLQSQFHIPSWATKVCGKVLKLFLNFKILANWLFWYTILS